MTTSFSAGPPALGYFYQARYALYTVLSNEELELSIESLDDIAFEEEGSPRELLQLKHHINRASLSDSSPDLWKTLRVWSELVQSGEVSLGKVILTLVTTAQAEEGSIASYLRPGEEKRDTQLAAKKLLEVAYDSKNQSLIKAFDAFKGLNSENQKLLVNSIQILDCSPDIVDVSNKIQEKVKYAVRREHLNGLYERLEGWWFTKVVNHLKGQSAERISGFEVRDKIPDIAEQFKPDALPIDFLELELSNQPDVDKDTRNFVTQLKTISVNNRRIEKAILDYYRAFEQRSRWAREDLLIGDELEKYEKKLADEWERHVLACQDDCDYDENDDEQCQKFGRDVYRWVDQDADIRIRPQVTEEYVMRGSFHLLADQNPPRVWWHPQFVKRLAQIPLLRRSGAC
jgi:hypothetical protein